MATKKTISNSFVVNTVEDGIDGKDGKDGKDGINGKDGKDGERGKVGRFFYYAGVFDSNNTTQEFLVNDAQAPFFKTGETTFHVFNPEDPEKDGYTMSEMCEESGYEINNKPFEIMTNDFKYLITEALFSDFAHLGSAIINGDWMMSTHGQIGGVNFLNDNYIEITDVESKNTDLTPPYTLFSTGNPSSDGSIEHNVSYGTGDNELKVKFDSVNTNKFLENIKLEENTTYFAHIRVRTEPTGGNGNYYLKVDETDVGSILTSSNVYETKIIFFKVKTSGNYTLSVRSKAGGSSATNYGSLGIDYWKIGVASFAPRYAVNLKTGMSLQGYGFSSGAIRRNKVVIDDFSKGYYTYDKSGYDVGILDLDKCGSLVEIDGIYVYLQLPMYCHSINASEEERNKARSFVGTKLLIYIINDGGIFSRFKNSNDETTDHKNEFCYKVSKENGTIKYHSQSFAVVDGEGTIEKVMEYPQFVELECVTGLDEDGEIIYWKVNTIGKI